MKRLTISLDPDVVRVLRYLAKLNDLTLEEEVAWIVATSVRATCKFNDTLGALLRAGEN